MFRTLLISLFITSTALATTWTVDDDGKADFDNIQAAIDASSDGDEIIVMPGTYTSTQDGHVVNMLGKAVTLRSSDPSDPDVVAATIIDGENTRRGLACFNGETSKTIISGFTITNGYGAGFDYNGDGDIDWFEDGGGGMYNNSSSPTLIDCTFENNTADNGGGGMLNADNSSPTLIDCTFTGNTYAQEGGGMFNENSNPTLTDCTFENNSAWGGGGMYNNSSSPTLDGCTFTGNTAYDGGGMFNVGNSSPSLTDCTFENNSCTGGGGGMFNNLNANPTLTGCTFTSNSADYYGGGMCNYSSDPTLENCTFTDNSAANLGKGGGMYNSGSDPTLTNCRFEGNFAWYYGGGMYNFNNSNPTLIDTTVCGNTPDQINGDWTDNGGNCIAESCDDANDDGIPDDCECLADINGDGYVNVTDLLTIIDQWGLTDSPADVNFDGIVDVTDLLIVVGNWGACE
jgi:parallel beta-helix repeat protein